MNDITENGKYYIPSIEEFHIGFEFEQNHSEYGWEKMIYNRLSTKTQLSYRHPTSVLNSDLIGGFIRVCKLSHEDILLCGWIPQGVLHYDSGEMIDGYDKGSFILHQTESGWVIYRQDVYNEHSGNWTQHDLFVGTINNINELRTIMKQLGIK